MRIHDILRRKGDSVITIGSDASLGELLALLTEHRIGAVVVSDADGEVTGIVSERDVITRLHATGLATENLYVRDLMTSPAVTCGPEDELETLARTMTDRRIRHLPVVVDGRLAGVVSIGDVVKARLDQLQVERDQLVDYVQQGG
ncbi:CBS domain-containing protein [uncultured Georgenia sp.]|uniref:CBS domain-containing protein n=1 Tax=uncultured Georgenia sp. TaxID=378209 RepID=UPI0026168B34|nr:CBS domain-containing protein [uncultured Georgenia sp.]HLV05076.1 CBS domain-containing protein [Actinomycetaceae bacterium]